MCRKRKLRGNVSTGSALERDAWRSDSLTIHLEKPSGGRERERLRQTQTFCYRRRAIIKGHQSGCTFPSLPASLFRPSGRSGLLKRPLHNCACRHVFVRRVLRPVLLLLNPPASAVSHSRECRGHCQLLISQSPTAQRKGAPVIFALCHRLLNLPSCAVLLGRSRPATTFLPPALISHLCSSQFNLSGCLLNKVTCL